MLTKFFAVIHACSRTREPNSPFTVTKIPNIITGGTKLRFEASNAKEAVAYVQGEQVKLGFESIATVFPERGFRSPPGLKKLAADLYYNPLLATKTCRCGSAFIPRVTKSGLVQPSCGPCIVAVAANSNISETDYQIVKAQFGG
jgi:hypothetical protein